MLKMYFDRLIWILKFGILEILKYLCTKYFLTKMLKITPDMLM